MVSRDTGRCAWSPAEPVTDYHDSHAAILRPAPAPCNTPPAVTNMHGVFSVIVPMLPSRPSALKTPG